MMSNSETATRRLDPRAAEARGRGRVYALLALAFHREPDDGLLAALSGAELRAAFTDCGVEPPVDEACAASLRGELSEEFARLFLVPGPGRVAPFESVYAQGGTGELWGPEAVDVKRFIEELGLRIEDSSLMPDHVAIELDVLAKLSDREAEAWEEGLAEEAAECRRAKRVFLERHPGRWLPEFFTLLKKAATRPFYCRLAELAEVLIDEDKDDASDE